MTTEEIAAQIQPYLVNNTLMLPGNALGSATMEQVFSKYLTDDRLIVSSAQMTVTPEAVTVTGTGGGRFLNLAVNATFTPTAFDTAVTVIGVTQAGWVFSNAFSSLSFGTYDNVPVDSFSQLILHTLTDGDTVAGLSFDGTLLVDGVLTEIVDFLNGPQPIVISGPIDVVSGIPQFSFVVPVRQGMNVGTLLGLNFSLGLTSVAYAYNPTTAPGTTTPGYTQDAYLSLLTSLNFTAKGKPMSVDAEMRFGTGALAGLLVGANGSPGVLLEAFEQWAGKSLQSGMPTLFDPSDYLEFSGLSCAIVPKTVQLVSFSVTVSTTQDWVVIPDVITVTDVFLELGSLQPTSNPTIIGSLTGTVNLGEDGDVAKIVLNASAPDYTLWGGLQDGSVVNVADLIAYLIPAATGIPSITLDYFDFSCQPSNSKASYSVSGMLTTNWVLDVSPYRIEITNAWVNLGYGPITAAADTGTSTTASSTTGSLGGTIVFDTVTFDITYTIPGIFVVSGAIPKISLSECAKRLADIPLSLPDGFDLVFTNCYVAMCYGSGNESANLEFQLSADVSGLGSVAFEALKIGNNWGYASGLSMGNASLADIPGLHALAPFVEYFSFSKIVLVVSTTDLPDFVFPDASVFSGGSVPTAPVVLPTSQGVVTGLNAYADIDLSSQPDLKLLMKFLSLPSDLSITLQVGVDVAVGSALYASMSGNVNSNMSVTGQFGAKLDVDGVDLYVSGTINTTLQGQPIVFDFTLAFVTNGAYLSGDFRGTIDFVIVQLSNLLLEIGIDYEGIPTIGFGAQIDAANFETSAMILLDSADPAKSMFVASISDISLGTFLTYLCNVTNIQVVPSEVMDTLNAIELSGTGEFSLTDTDNLVLDGLNNRDLKVVTAAFAAVGITLSNDSLSVIISVNTKDKLWHVTNTASNGKTTQSVVHYRLEKKDGEASIRGTIDPQLYAVPLPTQLGSTQLSAGYSANCSLDLFGFRASLTVVIEPTLGLTIDAEFSPLDFVVNGYKVIAFSSADGSGGPWLSVCTFQNDAASLTPHVAASGSINVLGVLASKVEMNFSATGGSFNFTASLSDVAVYTLGGNYTTTNAVGVSGSASIGVHQRMNFGVLGEIDFDASVGYSYSISLSLTSGNQASAKGGFSFEGVSFSIPSFELPLDAPSLAAIATDAFNQAFAMLQAYLADYVNWLNWLGGVILGIDTAEQVGQILADTYHLTYDEIASETSQILKYTSDQVAKALEGAGATAAEAMDTLEKTLNDTANEAASAVEKAFTGYHVDETITPHGDGDATPHTDFKVGHQDSGSHTDTKTHSDISWGALGHTDTHPFGDAGAHYDTPAVHTDIGSSHADIPAVHTDFSG